MSNANVGKKKKRIFYFDALRALAILAVIAIHVIARSKSLVFQYYGSSLNYNWLFGDFFWACLPIGVDLFLILSGALSLGREWDIKSFLGRRIPRIVGPFIFWGIALSAIVIFLQFQYPDFIHVVNGFGFNDIANFIIGAWRNKSWGFGPYWFFWMILGTYLIMPIFNKWLLHADLKEAEYFLVIWLITCVFDFTINKTFPIKLTYFSGPIGMVVLGYYLRHTKRKIFSNKFVPVILILFAVICEIYFSFMFSSSHSLFKFNRYSIFSAIEVIGIFLLFKNLSDVKITNKVLQIFFMLYYLPVIFVCFTTMSFNVIGSFLLSLMTRTTALSS